MGKGKEAIRMKRTLMFVLLGILSVVTVVSAILWNLDVRLPRSTLLKQTAPNGMEYRFYVPQAASIIRKLPLFVAFHGGTMDADDMVDLTRLNDLVEEIGFYVLYPEQDLESNAQRYWNWFLPENQTLGDNEPARVMEILDTLSRDHRIDDHRIYALGFSAGGAMALTMQILYPDVFSGIAIASALPFGAATNLWEAGAAMEGFLPDAEVLAARAIEAMPIETGEPIRAIVVHGLEDSRVDPVAGEAILKQLRALNDRLDDGEVNGSFPMEPTIDGPDFDLDPALRRHVRYQTDSDDGVLELYLLDGMTHRYPNPGSSAFFAWTDSLDFSLLAVRFLLREDR
jgi:poly(hydroxyalkanoate) depolymerase family esterase